LFVLLLRDPVAADRDARFPRLVVAVVCVRPGDSLPSRAVVGDDLIEAILPTFFRRTTFFFCFAMCFRVLAFSLNPVSIVRTRLVRALPS
jgi:hypothetical protein